MGKTKIAKALAVAATVAATLAMGGCASCARAQKSWDSNLNGGLDRTVTLYSTTGKVIKTWKGRIDLANTGDEIWFDLDGSRRVNINGGIVVVEEGL